MNGTYFPTNYQVWRQHAQLELIQQFPDRHQLPLTCPVFVTVGLQGKHRKAIDLDNAAGAVLDSVVSANILRGDNLNNVPQLYVSYEATGEPGVWVYLELLLF